MVPTLVYMVLTETAVSPRLSGSSASFLRRSDEARALRKPVEVETRMRVVRWRVWATSGGVQWLSLDDRCCTTATGIYISEVADS